MRCSLGYPPGIQGYMAAMDQMEHFGTDKVEKREFRNVSAYFQAHYHSLLSCGHGLDVCIFSYPPAPAPQVEFAQVNKRRSMSSVTRCRRADRDPAGGNNALRRLAGSHLSLLFAGGLSAKMFSDWLADAGEGLMTQQISKRAVLSSEGKMDRKTSTDGGLSEIDILRNVVPLLSRLLVGKTQRENIWGKKHRPKDWPQRLTWKNPTTTRKDTLEELQAKLFQLRSMISVEKLSTAHNEMLKLYDGNEFNELQMYQELRSIWEALEKLNIATLSSPSKSSEVNHIKLKIRDKLVEMLAPFQNAPPPPKRKCASKILSPETQTVSSTNNVNENLTAVGPNNGACIPRGHVSWPIKSYRGAQTIWYHDTQFQNLQQAPGTCKVGKPDCQPLMSQINNQQFSTEANSQQFSTETKSQQFSTETNSQQFSTETNSRQFSTETNSQQFRTETKSQQFSTETNSQQFSTEANSQQFSTETNSRQFSTETSSQQLNKDPDIQQFMSDQDIQQVMSDPDIQQLMSDPDVQQLMSDPDSQPFTIYAHNMQYTTEERDNHQSIPKQKHQTAISLVQDRSIRQSSVQPKTEAPDSHQSCDSGIGSNNPTDTNVDDIQINSDHLSRHDVKVALDQIFSQLS